jgi:deoxyadenosine kinase
MSKKVEVKKKSDKHKKIYVAISGLIAAGKTTLAQKIGKLMNIPVYYEGVIDNSYLADFYKDQKKYSFPLQIYLLNKRFEQQQQIVWSKKGAIQDRSIYEDKVFCKMLRDDGKMDKRDYDTYCNLFENMSNFMKRPNLIVHLDVTPEESLKRIKMRSRKCESTVPLEYLKKLYKAYDEFIENISKTIPVIKVNYKKFKSAQEMADIINKTWGKMNKIEKISYDIE